jgi:dolichol-phosphate mannosyltransferase
MKNIKGKISIVMPARNESERIVFSIEETAKTFNEFGCAWELIVVDDGSSDDTYQKVSQLAEKYSQLIVKRNPFHSGKGRAIKKSLRYIDGNYIVWLDADMDLHPIQLQTFFDIMRLDNADIVIGSKFHPNSVITNYSRQRRIISLGYYLLIRILFNLPCHDTQTGLKLFRAEVLEKVFPRILVKKYAFDLEVLVNAYHLGYKIAEAPIDLQKTQRPYGRIGIKAILTTFWDTLAIFYRMYLWRGALFKRIFNKQSLGYYDRIDYHRRKGLLREFKRVRR